MKTESSIFILNVCIAILASIPVLFSEFSPFTIAVFVIVFLLSY